MGLYLTSSVLRLDRGAFPHHLFLNCSGISSWGPSKRKFFPRPCDARTSFGRRGFCLGKTPLSSPLNLPPLMSSLLPPTYLRCTCLELCRIYCGSLFLSVFSPLEKVVPIHNNGHHIRRSWTGTTFSQSLSLSPLCFYFLVSIEFCFHSSGPGSGWDWLRSLLGAE